MGSGLPLSGEIGGQDHLLHQAIVHPLNQLLHADVMRSNAFNRTEFAHQYKVKPLIGQGSL